MSDTVIKVENVGKLYRLGEVGTGTISHDLNRWWSKLRGRDDPFAKIGETNDRTSKGNSDYVWSLKDINFEVKQGDVLGIIGRNGAGKSTLLKLISKVTTPTEGKIKIKGRIASLLEVGTGFHPELTGRENIYLNGAILGMTKIEINKKFDEIVDFSGVERYIDTPVKRYSSGMYVRLAFAVAAFLEPEILIVDEVLAVGDAEFQKKCLGRMKDVTQNDGRSILFVSHNMAAIKSLCNKGILLANGKVEYSGTIEQVIQKYTEVVIESEADIEVKYYSNLLEINEIICNKTKNRNINLTANNNEIEIEVYFFLREVLPISIELKIYDKYGVPIAFVSPSQEYSVTKNYKIGKNVIRIKFDFPQRANKGTYLVSLWLSHPGVMTYMEVENLLSIDFEGYVNKTGNVFSYDNGAGFLFLKTKTVL